MAEDIGICDYVEAGADGGDFMGYYAKGFHDGPTFCDAANALSRANGRIQSAAILGALARVALLGDDKAPTVKISGSKGAMVISSTGADGREADEEIDASWADKPLQGATGFNGKYLKAVLDGIAAETVVLALSPTHDGPTLVTPRGRDDTLALIMPVRM